MMSGTATYQEKNLRSSRSLAIRGVQYNVNEWGDRGSPLLVLLHGFADAGACFQFVVDELQKDWFVIAPDWRGFGDSRHAASSYWFPDYLADLDAILEVYSPKDTVRLVGHSMGGNIASMFSGVFPERVEALVNVEGFGLRDGDPDDAPGRLKQWIESGRSDAVYSEYQFFDELAARIRRRSPHLSAERALFVAEQWAARGDDGVIRLKVDPAHKLRNPVLYRRREAEACWGRVQAPVLFVVGGETDFNSPDMRWVDPEAPCGNFPQLTPLTIPDARHMVHFEQPRLLAEAIESFLTS